MEQAEKEMASRGRQLPCWWHSATSWLGYEAAHLPKDLNDRRRIKRPMLGFD